MYLEKYDLKGSVAVIVGGAGSIGLASAAALAECGAEVVIADASADAGERAVQNLGGAGHVARFSKIDVTDSDDVNRCAQSTVAGEGYADILVNCAGISAESPAAEIPDAQWQGIIDVNLTGLFWCCRAFGKIMLERGRGSIVNIGSMSGLVAVRPQIQAHYGVSKAGVHMLTKSLASEWGAKGVRVNAIAPTFIETPMTRESMDDAERYAVWLGDTPMHRVGQPDEIASAVLFLASDAASLMTGAVLVADAGYTAW
jgi:NAD(P)-dependent dehydrogenase (short-subunit alcohol dehydrogenase family)